MKSIAYVRCSTEEQADSGLGLEAQRQRIEAYAAMRGLELVEIIADEGVSGGKPLAARPGGARLLKALSGRKPAAPAVVMLKLDRGFRNASDCLATVDAWDSSRVALHVVDLGGNAIDTTSAAGRFMLVVLAGAAEMERNLTRERTRSALDVKRRAGERVSRHIPFGFRLAEDGIRLVPVESEQGLIRRIRAWRQSGMSYGRIARRLAAEGVATARGGAWHPQTIKGILQHDAAITAA